MRYPRFIAEMASEAYRPRLYMGVVSGYALLFVFGLIALIGQSIGVLPWDISFFILVAFKAATNSAAWLALKVDRLALPFAGINTAADAFVMTGAIYITGGMASPLFVLYVVLLTVLALLTNQGVTIAMAVLCFVLFSTMSMLVELGVLTQHASPVDAAHITGGHVALGVGFAASVLFLTAFYTTRILHEMREKQRELERRTDQLVEASRQRSQFMANITHELRTPIHGITSVSELIESEIYGPLNERQRSAQLTIQSRAKALLAHVDELLMLAKSEANKLEFAPAEVDIVELSYSLASSVRPMVEVKSQVLQTVVPRDLPATVTDRGKLNQIVLNLLTNAIKFTPEQGTVTLRVSAADGVITFEVEDNGVGIPAELLARIFDPFFQADGTDERSYGGSGLGLALVQRLCAVIGATIQVQSQVGEGSTFRVELPIATDAGLSAAAQ